MKLFNLLIVIFLILTLQLNAQDKKKLNSIFSYAKYYSEETGPYVETHLSVFGKSANFVINDNGKYQASIEVTMIFKKNEEVVTFSKNNLLSPEINDTSETYPNFIDIQRFSLPNGIYNFELSIKDNNSDNKPYKYFDIIQVYFDTDTISSSTIQFVESYKVSENVSTLTRNGFDIVPYISNFFPTNMSSLKFYCEIYNSNKIKNSNGDLLVKYYIQDFNTKKTLNDFSRYKKIKAGNINVILAEFSIDQLPTGNYTLNIDVVNNENKVLLQQNAFFQRANKKLDAIYKDPTIAISNDSTFAMTINETDSLNECLKCLIPIADMKELDYIKNLLSKNDVPLMQHFLYNFWLKRNSSNPEAAWNYYQKQVEMVNNLYSDKVYKGYETDRGRIYLKYGAPNNVITSKHEPTAYPYEIWHYYKVGEGVEQQTNVKFVFYNPDLVGNYQLLHSTAKGEVYDPQWERRLSKRNNTLYNFDATNSDPQYGSHAEENFNK
ncbi:MAG: hypothetical protein Kow0068_04670 [Marinilabiliales bacterium]